MNTAEIFDQSGAAPASGSSNGKVQIAWLLAALTMMLLAFAPTVISLHTLWLSEDNPAYSHGHLLLIVVVYLVYQQWSVQPVRLSLPGLFVLAGLSGLWFLAQLGFVQIAAQLVLVSLPVALLWSAYGLRQGLTLGWPFLLMILATPLFDVLHYPLQITTAPVVGIVLNLMNISTWVDGIFITIPAGNFEVARGCSGLSQFVVAIIIACLYSWMMSLRVASTVLMIVCAMLVAYLTNVIRIIIVVTAAQMTDMQTSLVHDHYTMGWILFGVGMAVFLWLANQQLEHHPQWLKQLNHRLAGYGQLVFTLFEQIDRLTPAFVQKQRYALPLLVLLIGPVLFWIYGPSEVVQSDKLQTSTVQQLQTWQDKLLEQLNQPSAQVSWQMMPWQLLDQEQAILPMMRWQPYVYNAQAQKQWRLQPSETRITQPDSMHQSVQSTVDVAVYSYTQQTAEHEAVQYSNRVYDNENWRLSTTSTRQLGSQSVAESVIYQTSGLQRLVWQWYIMPGQQTASDSQAKLATIVNTIAFKPAITRVVISTVMPTMNDVALQQAREQLRPVAEAALSTITY